MYSYFYCNCILSKIEIVYNYINVVGNKMKISNKIKIILIIILSIILLIILALLVGDKLKNRNYNKFKDFVASDYEKIIKPNVEKIENSPDTIYYIYDNYIVERKDQISFDKEESYLKERGSIVFYYYKGHLDDFKSWKESGYKNIETIIEKADSKKVYAQYEIKK